MFQRKPKKNDYANLELLQKIRDDSNHPKPIKNISNCCNCCNYGNVLNKGSRAVIYLIDKNVSKGRKIEIDSLSARFIMETCHSHSMLYEDYKCKEFAIKNEFGVKIIYRSNIKRKCNVKKVLKLSKKLEK